MRTCKQCQKKIPEDKRANAEFCSGACKTEYHREKHGLPAPDFLSITKPLDVPNIHRALLSEEDKNLQHILKMEIDNLTKAIEPIASEYKELHGILLEIEISGIFPRKFLATRPIRPRRMSLPKYPLSYHEKGAYELYEAKYIKRFSSMTVYEIDVYERLKVKITEYKQSLMKYEESECLYIAWESLIKDFDGMTLGFSKLKDKCSSVKEKLEYYQHEISLRKNKLKEPYEEIEERLREVSERKRGEKSRNRLTGAELQSMQFKTYNFSAEWSELLGKPSRPFVFMIFGDAKAGKSYFSMSLAEYLTNFGEVGYFAVEEGIGETTKQKIEVTKAYDIFIEQAEKIEDLWESLQSENYKFVFIDSVSALGMGADEFARLRIEFPSVSFVAILQTNKNNDFAGEKRWKHDVDAILEISKEGTRTTKVKCIGRFGSGEKIISY